MIFVSYLMNPFKGISDIFNKAGDKIADAATKTVMDSVNKAFTGCLFPILSCGKKLAIIVLILIAILVIFKVLGKFKEQRMNLQHTEKMQKIQERSAETEATLNTIKKVESDNEDLTLFR